MTRSPRDSALHSLDDRGRYELVGRLEGAWLDAGFPFEEALFASEYAYLSGQMVCLTVDGIHIWFETPGRRAAPPTDPATDFTR